MMPLFLNTSWWTLACRFLPTFLYFRSITDEYISRELRVDQIRTHYSYLLLTMLLCRCWWQSVDSFITLHVTTKTIFATSYAGAATSSGWAVAAFSASLIATEASKTKKPLRRHSLARNNCWRNLLLEGGTVSKYTHSVYNCKHPWSTPTFESSSWRSWFFASYY